MGSCDFQEESHDHSKWKRQYSKNGVGKTMKLPLTLFHIQKLTENGSNTQMYDLKY
jgi:hypothetical protein